jgi:aminoglycoside 6'-N-acetyltransferase
MNWRWLVVRSNRHRKKVNEVRLDKFEIEQGSDLLLAWINAPHVSRWLGDPERTIESFQEQREVFRDALIVADDVPVGYIRWEIAPREDLDAAGLFEIPDGVIDIDIAIGELDYIGCGVGPRAIKLAIEKILVDKEVQMIMIATSVENISAIQAFEKAGFQRIRKFQDPDGEMWLFLLDRSDI